MVITETLNLKVSFQQNAWSSLTKEITINDTLKIIKDGLIANEIIMLRKFLSNNEIEKYDSHKKRLPGVTFSGTYNGARRRENLKNYNSILVIDIDKIDPQEIEILKNKLIKDNFVFSLWESPSKKGLKGLISLDYTFYINNDNINEVHKIAFDQIALYFLNKYNTRIDISGSDITRLCFLSYDSNLVLKEHFTPFTINSISDKDLDGEQVLGEKKARKNKIERTIKLSFLNPKGKNSPLDRQTIQSIIKFLTKRNLSITTTYEKWYRVAYAIANTFTYDVGEKYYLKLCRLDGPKHDEGQSKYLLYYCYDNTKGEISFKTIYFLAREQGYKNKGGSEGAS